MKSFTDEMVKPLGVITSLVTTGARLLTTTVITNFLVVWDTLSYNTIIGHLTLNKIRAITSTYHLKMKFLTEVVLGEVWANMYC